MNASFFLRLIHQAGHALLLLGACLIGAEYILPGFASPYIHPYWIIFSGVCVCLVVSIPSQQVKSRQMSILALLISFLLCLVLLVIFPKQKGMIGLSGAGLLLIVAFFLAYRYADDI